MSFDTRPGTHWAADLIGMPWAKLGAGPFAFDCRGLVRECAQRRGLPEVPEHEEARGTAWRAIAGAEAQEDDLITMQGPDGAHVGYMTRMNDRLGVLHANGYQTEVGPTGMVEFQELDVATAHGYSRFRFWRAAR